MNDLLLILTPILLGDVANPVLFALLVYLAASPRGALLSSAALAGHTAAYFGSGVVIAFAFTELTEFMNNPSTLGSVIGGALGIALLYVAWLSSRSSPEREPEQPEKETSGSAFVTGAIVNFIGIPFGLPYFVAIDQILKADLSLAGSLAVLAGYNLAYMAPFLLVPILTLVMGADARALLQRMSAWVEKVGGVLLPLIMVALGVFLILDAGYYFATGEGLY
jgi:cytochrome c biogenesis protein CcdA